MHMVGENQEGDIRDRKDGLQYGCTYYKYEEHKCARGGGTSIWSNVNLRKMGKRGASTPASGRDG